MLKNIVISVLALCLTISLALHLVKQRGGDVPTPPVESSSPEKGGNPVTDLLPKDPPKPERDPKLVAFDDVFKGGSNVEGLKGAAIGFCLIGPAGETLYEYNADTAQIPASSLKTLTTATALEVLGPDFRFKTRLGVSAANEAEGAGVKGDLILVGGGDPMLSMTDLETWAKGLAEAGVKSIPGRVIGDGRFFPGSPFADFWNWGDIGNGYGSPVSGLNLEHNRFKAVLIPGEKENEAAILAQIVPEVPGVSWMNESLTGPEGSGDGIVIHGGERAAVMHLRGTVPPGEEMVVTGAAPDPERFAAHHLRLALVAAGIEVTGEAFGAGDLWLEGEIVPEISSELLVHQSPPLLDIVTSIHATSDNHETECLYRMLGVQTGLPPDEAIRQHWKERGLDLTGLRMVDGSGLARADHITPKGLALLQHFAAGGPEGEAYVGSLLATPDEVLRFKAGAMSAVRSYTGFVKIASGERLSYALIVNHYSESAAVQELQQNVFSLMAAW